MPDRIEPQKQMAINLSEHSAALALAAANEAAMTVAMTRLLHVGPGIRE